MKLNTIYRVGLAVGIILPVMGAAVVAPQAQDSSASEVTSADHIAPQVEVTPTVLPRLAVEPLSREQIDIFLDSVRAGSPFTPPQTYVSQKVDAATSGIWSGVAFDADGEVVDLVLRFRPSVEERLKRAESGKSAGQLADSVDIGIRLGIKGLQFSHSMARDPQMQNGFLSPLKSDKRHKTRTAFVRGVQESGMHLSVPPMLSGEAAENWGVLICPRAAAVVKDPSGRSLQLELTASPYELSEVKMSIVGSASTRVPTLNSKERLKMRVSTTQEVPPAIISEDEEISVSPSLQIAYHPSASADFFRFAPHASTQQELRLMAETENSAGYIRRAYFASTLYIQKLTEPSPVSVVVNGAMVARDEGVCYVVQRRKNRWAEYGRVAPSRPAQATGR